MELKGIVSEIIYNNEINGYTVCVVETDDELITSVGYLPFINIGDTLILKGEYVVHPNYGEQFKIETFEKILPEDSKSLEKYLGSGVIKGVGKATAKKIVDSFKQETISILKFEPEKLTNIKGISLSKAQSISESFNKEWELWQIVKFLEKYGVGANNAQKVYKELGQDAISKIEENPYILLGILYGVNFKEIDKIGMNLGVDCSNETRVQSGIKYSITIASTNGHTCVLKHNLIEYAKNLLNIEDEIIENSIINLNAKKEIAIEKIDENEWVYLYPFYKAEVNIAEKILKIKSSKPKNKIKDYKSEIKKIEEKVDIKLSEEQKEALEAVIKNNLCIITGGPGTGKTTIIKFIIELFKNTNSKIILAAPTGRAAKRMTESSGYEAKTIHRALELVKQDDNNLQYQVDLEIKPLDADIVIVDEMSMVDVFLMNNLLKAIYNGTKLILVGDIDQLPSVGPGNVLKDLISSGIINTISLKKIFRQAQMSKIIQNAHRVNEGEKFMLMYDDKECMKNDFFYINETNQSRTLNQVLSLCSKRLKEYGNYDFFKDIQVLTPTKKGMLGTKELNKELQNELNPKDAFVKEKAFGQVILRKGDRVMQIKNNYDIIWEKHEDKLITGTGVFNGELGIIDDINEIDNTVTVIFDDDKIVTYTFSELEQLEHSYATTIHKSQGSEFNVVILVLPNSSPMLLTRNLLYTGITRAKEMLIVIGNEKTIDFMIENNDIKKRNTGLEHKLMVL